jgi:hypothetical protein
MLKIEELKGNVLKKALNAKNAMMRYHNKNKSGGNFAMNLLGIDGRDYELSGAYCMTGEITELRFGNIYYRGLHYDFLHEVTLESVLKFINECTQTLKTDQI